jgi:hypothetical protein
MANSQRRRTAPRPGYPALADLMGQHGGMAMYKQFASLSAHSLLMQQVALLDLQRELDLQAELNPGFDEKATTSIHSQPPTDGQWQLVLTIRQRLKEYRRCVTTSKPSIADDRNEQMKPCCGKPKKYDLEVLRDWLAREKGGDNFLSGIEDLPWLESETSDLVAVSGRDFDTITRWTAETFVPWLYRSKILKRVPVSGQEELGLVEWDDTTYLRTARGMSVVVSSLIPSLAIVILYFIHNLIARILTAMGLSFVFSVALALSTPARPAEIFAASAA